ncbi:acyltransferase family protein [uncultured Microbacterium sp.]|uniref:acyltransferase family protein n=1 Tax=uncultured Microbacterium sp. TaxID=191216 RepID=UPI00260EF77A|nr:acyltransferase family protein [uncultured Microbacterium sp.]
MQALRALAVIAVILNHLWPDKLTGGYIGVDVFFVISGYLITAHLLREGERDNKIALGRFWVRRIRRLLPASLLVLLVCGIFTAIVVPITSRSDNYTQIGAAAVYVVNWVLAANSLDYFAQEAGHTLVTHFWSLSVEEQFYIIWPILALCVILATRRSSARRRRLALGLLFGTLLVLSFTYATWSTSHMAAAAYFQTPGRVWEFAAGGLLSLLPTATEQWRQRLVAVTWACWAILIASTFVLNSGSGVPGAAAVIPVAATMALIGIGEPTTRVSPNVITRWRPIQFMGDVSYSAYLWHYPLIIGASYAGIHLTAALKVVLVAITVVVSYLSKRFVEDPVRAGALPKAHPRIVLGTIAAAMAVIVASSLVGVTGIQERTASASAALMRLSSEPSACFGAQASPLTQPCPGSHTLENPDYALVDSAFRAATFIPDAVCSNLPGKTPPISTCVFGASAKDATHQIAVVGDSHAMMWLPAIRQIPGARTTTFVRPGCPPTADIGVLGHEQPDIQGCAEWRLAMIATVAADPDIDTVVVAARESLYLTASGTHASPDGYAQVWRKWAAAGKRVIVLADVPEFQASLDRCLTIDESSPSCTQARPIAADSTLGRSVAMADDPAITLVDENSLVCGDRCHLIVGGIPAYADSNHLSGYFTRSIGDGFLAAALSEQASR